MLKKAFKLTFAFILILLIAPKNAHAYLDPGGGSYLIQIVVASVVGAGYFLKVNWGKIRDVFSKKDGKKTENEKEDK
ncbi:MAG: hypothetical protein ABIH88_02660 [Patescibacteria group bacterium]|nr:hypothetical protein [Patescibacteria group bacterium]